MNIKSSSEIHFPEFEEIIGAKRIVDKTIELYSTNIEDKDRKSVV